MIINMRVYCAFPFGESFELQEHFHTQRPAGFLPAFMVYRIRGARLYFADGAKNVRGGVMVIGAAGYSGGSPIDGLLDDIAYEIKKRDFEGIVLDSGGDVSPIHTALAARIVSALRPFPVYLPAAVAAVVEGSVALVQTAISGGTLERHLNAAINKFGASNIAVEADRLRMDFTLPATSDAGESFTAQRLSELSEFKHTFFSEDLCVNYFMYKSNESHHMVLYDDAESMRKKLSLAERLGITRAFLYYPNTYDIITELR